MISHPAPEDSEEEVPREKGLDRKSIDLESLTRHSHDDQIHLSDLSTSQHLVPTLTVRLSCSKNQTNHFLVK